MSDSKSYLVPLGLAAVGALFGLGRFGGLHETIFGSENESKIATKSYNIDTYSGYCNEITFKGNDSDGYIYQKKISLTRVGSGISDDFYLFNKGGVDYVATSKNGPYYRLARRMTIDNIDYKY